MLISLGHSCQTRFVLDDLDASARRMPFDFNITTRQALVRALETDGAALRHDEGTARVYRMRTEGREGIAVGGLYFWHDYPLAADKLRLAEGWQREIARVNEKYTALWGRLSELLRSDMPKTLVLSNSQHNLGQFSDGAEDFDRRFGLGRDAFVEIAAALDAHGARSYRLLFLSRSIADLAQTANLGDDRLDHRFVGTLSLRPDHRVPDSLALDGSPADIASFCGTYDDGLWQVRPHSPMTAIVHRRTAKGIVPHGAITLGRSGPVLWREGRDRFVDIRHADDGILFADGGRWRRD